MQAKASEKTAPVHNPAGLGTLFATSHPGNTMPGSGSMASWSGQRGVLRAFPPLLGAASVVGDCQILDLSRLALDTDFKWTAADFAICDELLARNAGVNEQLESLAAERALNGFGNLHRPQNSTGANSG
jgi:hypothetical protein